MDQLSALLETVRFRSIIWHDNELSAPWGLRMPGTLGDVPEKFRPANIARAVLESAHMRAPLVGAQFYILTEGQAFVQHEDLPDPVEMNAGDLLMIFPGGKSHAVSDSPRSVIRPIWEVRTVGPGKDHLPFRHGGGGALTRMLYGGLVIEDDPTFRLLSVLPTTIKINGENGQPLAWVADALRLLRHENSSPEAGVMAVNSLIARFIFVRVIRNFVAELPSGSEGWMRSFLDPGIGPILGFIHLRPEAPWTVDALAKAACMSRSTFAARFTELVGQSPLQYVTYCRMQKAKDLLNDPRISIKETASLVGYGSEAAFSTAFKRSIGVSPYAFKKQNVLMAAAV